MAIDWDYWLKLNTVNDWEAVALTLNINPSDINLDSIEGINYVYDEIVPKHKTTYQKRMRLLEGHRWEIYDYLDGSYFSGNSSKFKEVFLKKFLLWLKYENQNWDLPHELKVYMGTLDNYCPKISNKIQKVKDIENNNKKEWLIKDVRDPEPEQDWYISARYFARQHLRNDKTLLIKREILASKVSDSLKIAKIFKRGGKKPPAPSTVLKALSNIDLP